MHPNITKIIDQYLLGELSSEERVAFEARLGTNPELQEELQLQQSVQDAAVRASARADIQQVARGYRINRIVRWGAAGLGIAVVVVTSAYFIQSYQVSPKDKVKTNAPLIAEGIADDLNAFVQFDNVPVQYFSIPQNGDVKLSEQGVLLSVPEHAFLLNGKTYSGPSIVQFQEAMDAATIVKSQLNTESGDRLLETQGMFSLQAYTPSGDELEMNPAVGVYLQVPVDECKSGMQLFEGVPQQDGSMDWQNPSKLEKIPVSVSMSELDFYPIEYENKLDALKWRKNKIARDSLYLSFEDAGRFGESVEADTFGLEGGSVSVPGQMNNQAADVQASFPGGYKSLNDFIRTSTNYPDRAIQKGISGSVYVTFTVDPEGNVKNAFVVSGLDKLLDKEALRVINSMPRWKPAEKNTQPIEAAVTLPINFFLDGDPSPSPSAPFAIGVNSSPLELAFPQDEAEEAVAVDEVAYSSFPRISPAKVLGFWKSKFNNTNLATREFERRMRAIHSTCNDAVLEKYTRNLNKSISQIDSEVAAMGYPAFNAFAAEKVGAVNVNNPHIKNLQAFYEKGVKILQKEAKKNRDWERKLNAAWDAHISSQRTEHLSRTFDNDAKGFEEERDLNMVKALKDTKQNVPSRTVRQLPDYQPSAMEIYPQFRYTAAFTLRSTGACNIDSFVSGTTARRETNSFTANGNTTTLKYNDFSFEVEDPTKYIKVFGYVFPNKLHSYKLINGVDGKFSYPLNNEIIYDVCVVGITETGYEYFQKQSLKEGQLGTVKMESLTEADLDASLRQLNGKRISRPAPIFGELDWIKAEQKNYTEQKKRRDMKTFREKVIQSIYPCYTTEANVVEAVVPEIRKVHDSPALFPLGIIRDN